MHEVRARAGMGIVLLAALGAAGFSLTESIGGGRGGDGSAAAQQLVREVVANELTAQAEDHSLWRYRQTKQEHGETESFEFVQTNQGEVHRLLAVNGQPLAAEEEQKEEARINRLVSNQEVWEDLRQKEQQDARNERRLMQMLPDAFCYQFGGTEGALVKIEFRPDPAFHPSRREGQVFHHMQGNIWVDPSQKRLARIEGHLTSEVKFGGGILGHLNEGGTFLVVQQEVADGHWELTRLTVNMEGEIMFFKAIHAKEDDRNSDFGPVRSDITLEGAARLLQECAAAGGA